jgi:F5/8 type C domain
MQGTDNRGLSRLRKRPLVTASTNALADDEIDVARLAVILYSSERPSDPVEHLFDGASGAGATRWISARPDTTEQIIVEFNEPQPISRLVYEVEERERERTQEVRAEISEDGGRSYRQILAQDYNFSPAGATFQRQDQRFERRPASHLRLTIVPNKNGSGAATLTTLRLFS